MSLFSRKNRLRVQSFLLKLINNNSPALKARLDGPRLDSRVNLVVVVVVVPIDGDRLQTDRTFTAVTKDFSNNGVSVVVDQPFGFNGAILGFRFEGEMTFLRAETKHLDPMGGGLHQLGFHLTEIVSSSDYPELESLKL